MNAQPSPLFVVGMNGSGTTMLADSLGRHPGLYMLPLESKVLPYFVQRRHRYGDLRQLRNRRRLADDLGRCKAYWQVNGKGNVKLSDEQLAGDGMTGVVDAIYGYLAARQGKTRWGDKSPTNTIHIAVLAALFPAAQFIHIVRDGRDAAQSFHRRWGYDPLHTISRWKRTVLMGQRQGGELGPRRYLEVSYEALTTNPELQMRRICDFAGLAFDPCTLQSSMNYMDPGHPLASSGAIVLNSEKWQAYFDTPMIAAMESIAGKLLAELGYPATDPGDTSPSAAKRKYWLVKDAFARSVSFFSAYGFKAIPMYLRVVRNTAKQYVAGMQSSQ